MLLMELLFMHSHAWVTDYKADTLPVQFDFAINIEGISYKEQIYNCEKILSKTSTILSSARGTCLCRCHQAAAQSPPAPSLQPLPWVSALALPPAIVNAV